MRRGLETQPAINGDDAYADVAVLTVLAHQQRLENRSGILPERPGGLDGARGTDVETLAAHAREAGIAAEKLLSCGDIYAAYQHVCTLAQPEDTVVVFGSFVTVAAVLEKHT